MKSINKMSWLAIIITIALIIWATVFTGSAQFKRSSNDEGFCNPNRVPGTYSFMAWGTILPDHPLGFPAGPYNSAGSVTLYNDGTYDLSANTTYNGTPVVENFEGSYTVSSQCVVTLKFGTPEIPLSVTYSGNQGTQGYAVILLPKSNVSLLSIRQ